MRSILEVGRLTLFAVCIACICAHTILEEFHCRDSQVEYRSTLRGGKEAGVFRNMGTVKNIQECIFQCCQIPQCDVAMLDGSKKSCVGVQCFNDTSCESIPMEEDDEQDIHIAHVTGRGMGNEKYDNLTGLVKSEDSEKRCPHNEILYNMKLSGGLMAGKFTDIGIVKSVMTCIRYCCESKVPCDLAFMLGNRCFLVKCYTEDKCQALPATGADYKFKQRMAYVSPWLYNGRKKIVKVPNSVAPHHVKCVQSKVYSGSKLLGGGLAGDYTDIGQVGKMHICARLCCEEATCDIAYMFGKNCFLVKCGSEKACRVIPDDELQESNTTTFDKQIQYIVKRRFGVHLNPDGTLQKKSEQCQLEGEIKNDTMLSRGLLSGTLTVHKDTKNVKHCIEKCCATEKCNVALMLSGMCYSLECANKESCKAKKATDSLLEKNPIVAYVKRGDISMAPPDKPMQQLITSPMLNDAQ